MRVLMVVRIGRCDPDLFSVSVSVEQAVVEIQPEDPELPHLIGDVLAGVGDSPIGSDEDLVGFVLVAALVRVPRHHPAAFVSAFVDVMDHAELLHRLKRLVPKMQVQYLRLSRQQIVSDSQPFHGVGDAFDVAGRDIISEFRSRVAAFLDQVQHLGTPCL